MTGRAVIRLWRAVCGAAGMARMSVGGSCYAPWRLRHGKGGTPSRQRWHYVIAKAALCYGQSGTLPLAKRLFSQAKVPLGESLARVVG